MSVFVCYARSNESWERRISERLTQLQVDHWSDRKIEHGDSWRHVIESRIRTATGAILLVSDDMLNSEFVQSVELPLILERSRRGKFVVMPILVEPCAWEAVEELKKFELRPRSGRALSELDEPGRERELSDIAAGILRRVSRRSARPRVSTVILAVAMLAAIAAVLAMVVPWGDGSGSTQLAPRRHVGIVLDASSHMTSAFEGGTKWDGAIRACASYLGTFDDRWEVLSLRTHGRDCSSDVVFGFEDRPVAADELQSTRPEGRSAMLRAIKLTIGDIIARRNGGHEVGSPPVIVVIAGGAEVCHPDALQRVLSDAQAEGIQFEFRVFALAPGPEDTGFFEALAKTLHATLVYVSRPRELEQGLAGLQERGLANATPPGSGEAAGSRSRRPSEVVPNPSPSTSARGDVSAGVSESDGGSAATFIGPITEAMESCHKCHANEVRVWQTGQSAGGKSHRNAGAHLSSDKGKAYIAKVGSADVCAQCHTTGNMQHQGRPIGVSCESCHGAAKDWIRPHCSIKSFGDLQGNKALLEKESKGDRRRRVEACATAGMVRSDDLYGLASNCLGCHIVSEPTVLAAGHAAKSDGFELLKWSQGHVRHNFLWGKSNPMPDDNRKRMLFVAGKLAEYEHASAVPALKAQAGDVMKALKGLAKANAPVEGAKPRYDKRWIALIKSAREGMAQYKAAAQEIVEGMLDGSLPIDKGIKLPTEYK